MAELKTQPTLESVFDYLNSIPDEQRRRDSFQVKEMMEEITGESAQMWGDSIVGFGNYHYRYASGREGDWMLVGFSPRKQALTLYIMPGFDAYVSLLSKLGKFKTGKSCLYLKKLSDVNLAVLKELIQVSVQHMGESEK